MQNEDQSLIILMILLTGTRERVVKGSHDRKKNQQTNETAKMMRNFLFYNSLNTKLNGIMVLPG